MYNNQNIYFIHMEIMYIDKKKQPNLCPIHK